MPAAEGTYRAYIVGRCKDRVVGRQIVCLGRMWRCDSIFQEAGETSSHLNRRLGGPQSQGRAAGILPALNFLTARAIGGVQQV